MSAGPHPAPTYAEDRRREPRGGDPRGQTDPRRGVGRRGERLAAEHLRRLGFSTLGQNVRTRHGEIDLICFDGRTLVFAEVKTLRMSAGARAPRPDQQPLMWLRRSQRERLRRLAVAWLSAESRIRPSARAIRFDAIGVTIDAAGGLQRIEHVEGAW
jgi:putative endonuclease